MEYKEEKIIEERKRKVRDFLLNKKFLIVLIGLIVLLTLAFYARTLNIPDLKDIATGNYTLGPDLDPYLFLRYAEYIEKNGNLMSIDYMRNVPLGFDTSVESKLLVYMIVYFHKIFSVFSGKEMVYSAIMFPVFMFLLTVIAFYLFIDKVFENKKYGKIIALISAAFLIVAPSLVPRTVAGIPEKESAAFFFMFLGFYFFLSSWKSESLKKGVIFSVLAGISTGLLGLIWGGVSFAFIVTAFAVFLEFILGKVSKRRILFYSLWFFISFLFLGFFFSSRYPFISMIDAPNATGLSLAVLFLIITDFLIFKTKIKELIPDNVRKKIPEKIISIIIFALVIAILGSIFFRIGFVVDVAHSLITSLTRSATDRLSFTVAENRYPYFKEWASNFGPIVRGIPLFFWLFFIGSIFLFYDAIKNLKRKAKTILIVFYILFLIALIFSRYSSSSIMSGDNTISRVVYVGSFLLLFFAFFYLLYDYHKKDEIKELKKVNSSYMFLVAFFFISIVGARGAIRLVMVLAIPAAAIVSYFSVLVAVKAKESKNKTFKIITVLVALIIIFAAVYSFYFNYQSTLANTRGMIPSSYTHQWQKAMQWVRENTPENSVFAHWWDYGYWLQSIGKRATVLDGGNAIGYWNHLLGRHVLTGQSEKEALEFLYSHNTTHFLIDSSDIGKYGAYSLIGSDENYDRYSQIATFKEDESNLKETKENIMHLYLGNQLLDSDFIWKTENGEEFLPSNKAGIAAVWYIENKKGEMKQPQSIFVYQGKQISIPLRYVYLKGKLYDFETGYGGALYIIPSIVSQGGGVSVKDKEIAMFITEKSMNALWVKLYLLNQAENFELVHTEENFIVRDLRANGLNVESIIYYQGVQGPIKIWKINYPSGIEFKEEYLNTDYPQSLRKKESFI